MACRSGSVQRVADKTTAAAEQIEKLQTMIEAQNETNKASFYSKLNQNLADARITDGREIGYNSAIKTEYTSEFSLDKIAEVVIAALKSAGAVMSSSVPNPAMSPAAIAAYTDVVNTVAEAAKSSSTSSASLSFSMNRLSPGMFAFLSASSISIKEEETFGSEAVTTTAIYYLFIQSIDDVKNEAKFGEAIIDSENLLKMKKLQAALTDELANDKIDIDTWSKKDDAYTAAIGKIKARLAADSFGGVGTRDLMAAEVGDTDFATQALVSASIKRLSTKGEAYKAVVEMSERRLADDYY